MTSECDQKTKTLSCVYISGYSVIYMCVMVGGEFCCCFVFGFVVFWKFITRFNFRWKNIATTASYLHVSKNTEPLRTIVHIVLSRTLLTLTNVIRSTLMHASK